MSNEKVKKDYFWKGAVVVVLAILCVQSLITYRVLTEKGEKVEKKVVSEGETLKLVPRQISTPQCQTQQSAGIQSQQQLTPRALPPLNLNLNNLPGVKPSAPQVQTQQPQNHSRLLASSPAHMSLNSMDPFDMDMREEMARMEAMMNAMMGGRIGGRSPFTHSVRAPMQGMGFSRSNSTPTVSLDKDRNYIVQLQIPGLDKSEIKAEVNGNILTVSGVQREEQSSSGKGGQSYVSSFSSFQNSFSLPGPAKSEGVKMDYKGDMLTIKIPKA